MAPTVAHFVSLPAPQGGHCACGPAKPVPRPLLEEDIRSPSCSLSLRERAGASRCGSRSACALLDSVKKVGLSPACGLQDRAPRLLRSRLGFAQSTPTRGAHASNFFHRPQHLPEAAGLGDFDCESHPRSTAAVVFN